MHAGAGGVGSAAIQLGVAAGARVIATAGGPEKLARCRELGADVAIDYREEDIAEAVLAATDRRGVDVVCDLVGGEVTERTYRCMAYGGRLMLTGFSGGIEAEDEAGLTPRPILFGNFSVGGVLMTYGDPARFAGTGIQVIPPRPRPKPSRRICSSCSQRAAFDPSSADARRPRSCPRSSSGWSAAETLGRTILDWSPPVGR